MKRHLRDIYYREEEQTIGAEPINRVVDTLEMLAGRNDVPKHEIFTRVAAVDEKVYYNLDSNAIVEIREENVSIRKKSDKTVLFKDSHPQVHPNLESRGSELLKLMKRLVKAPNNSLLLLTIWLCTCYIHSINHPITILVGKQGSTKSSIVSLLCRLIDPTVAERIAKPSDYYKRSDPKVKDILLL